MPDWIQPFRDFVATQEGRTTLFLFGGSVVAVLLLLALVRRWRGRERHATGADLTEDVGGYGPAPPLPESARQLMLYGLPVRMRLVVLTPLGLEAGSIRAEEVNELLNLAVPGLGDRLGLDLPKIRFWPTQLSQQGFVAAFRRNTQFPGKDAHQKHHVLVVGKVLRRGSPIAVGLALQSSEPNTLGPVMLTYPHQWMEVLRFQQRG